MADTTTGSISGTSNPYATGVYTPVTNDKNTLSNSDYFLLLAAQLQNQDMTNPLSNSEMMAQMTQMAMMESIQSMTTAMNTSTSVSVSTYAAGLVNKEVTVAVTEENAYGQPVPVGVKYGTVESVNLTGDNPTIKLAGDDKEYPISYVLGLGQIPDPYSDKKTEGDKNTSTDGVEGTDKEDDEVDGADVEEGSDTDASDNVDTLLARSLGGAMTAADFLSAQNGLGQNRYSKVG